MASFLFFGLIVFPNTNGFLWGLGTNEKNIDKIIEGLFENAEYEKACILVEKLYKKSPYTPNVNLYYAKCAYYRGDIDTAIAAYDRFKILNGENVGEYKSFANLHTFKANIEIANREYDQRELYVKDIYSSNIMAVLADFSVGYDSNVRYSAQVNDINFQDLQDYDAPESDLFTSEYIRLTHIYDDPQSSFYYKNNLQIFNKNYLSLSEEDFLQLEIFTGPAWMSRMGDFWLPFGYTYIATDYNSYAKIYSINPQYKQRFKNKLLLKGALEYAYEKQLQWEEGDKKMYSGEVSLSKWIQKNYFKAFYKYEQTEKELGSSSVLFIDRYSNEMQINYSYLLSDTIEFSISYLYMKTHYLDLAKTEGLEKRKDRLYKYSVYISYNITSNIGIMINYDKYTNKTNYELSNYKKELLGSGVIFYF